MGGVLSRRLGPDFLSKRIEEIVRTLDLNQLREPVVDETASGVR
jgi:hypothetical protein